MSGYGLLAERRGGRSRLEASDAFPVVLHNARRGLAKPSSHGGYLAMDVEPISHTEPISAAMAKTDTGSGIGALGLVFDRRWAGAIAQREEYSAEKFLELIARADDAGQRLGDFLLGIARRVSFDLEEYRRALAGLLGYTSPGYIFHPVPLDDGRTAIVAIGSGFEGSGDPAVVSKRREWGIDRLLSLGESLALDHLQTDRAGQIGYFVECLLGGVHGVDVSDLTASLDLNTPWAADLAGLLASHANGEVSRFAQATSVSEDHYRAVFPGIYGSGLDTLPGFRPAH